MEIHGNVFYMHCSDTETVHHLDLKPVPLLGDFDSDSADEVPTCAKCSKPMRPHIMFFDESYNEHFYRMESLA